MNGNIPPKVSINLVFHNPRFIAWCNSQLHKVINYSNRNGITTELIICSELDPKLFEHYPKHKYLRCKDGEDVGVKRNMCLEASRGRFICCWDQDDWYAKYRLKLCLELFEQLPPDVLAITTNKIFCYDLIKKTSYYVSCESESALFFKRILWKQKGRRFGTYLKKGEGNALIDGENMYVNNEYLMVIALRHNENTSDIPDITKDLGNIDDITNEEEKELLKDL